MGTFKGIRAGDRVTFRLPLGRLAEGRAQAFLIFGSHVVVDAGGAHGRPVVVDERNYVAHKPKR